MLGKRKWTAWGGRLREELNGVSGIAGVGGTVITVASLAVFTGAAAVAIGTGGAVLAFGAVGYAMYKAVPPRLRKPEDVVNRTVGLHELNEVNPPILKLAIIGPSRAGKTTLKSRLSFQATPTERTQSVDAYVVSVPSSPLSYLAVLDGGGEKFAQQFKIAEPCDFLCVILDHNQSDVEISVSSERLNEHAAFLKQV